MKQYSIRQHVAWLTLTPLLFLAISLESFFLHDRFSDLDHDLAERGQLIAHQLATGSEYGVFANNRTFLQNVAQGALLQQDVQGVAILDAASGVLVEAGKFSGAPKNRAFRANTAMPGAGMSVAEISGEAQPQPARVGTIKGPVNLQISVYRSSEGLQIYHPIVPAQVVLDEPEAKSEVQQIGTVVVEMSSARIEQLKLQLLWLTAGSTALFLIFPFGLIYLGSRNIVSPIRKLSDAIRALGDGRLETRVSVSGHVTELETLASGINDMSAKLQQAHAVLHQRTAKLIEAQHIAHLGNWEWDVVNNRVDWSDEIYRIFGLMPQQFGATYEAFLQAVYPEDRQFVDAKVREALGQGGAYNIDHRILLPDGSLRYVHEQAEVLRNEADQAVKMTGTVQDITDAKLAEEALRKANVELSLFRKLLDNSSDAIEVLDPVTLRLLDVNETACRVLGYNREELLSMSIYDIDPSFGPDAKKMIDGQMQKSGAARFEGIHRRKDGSTFAVEVSIGSADLDKPYGLGVVRDITERKLAEEKIRKLNEGLETRVKERTQQLLEAQEELVRKEKLAVLGQVAGSVGHELRNPLGVMSNAVYFLQTVLTDADDSVKEYLNIIKSEIAGSERIVSDLLDSVRTKPPQPEMLGIAELIAQTLRKCNVPPSVSVKLDIPATLPPLRVDAMQIQQVLRNLISNGVEAMPEGGVLEMRAVENKPDGTVTISVRDSGTGIAPEHLAKLFQPLFTTKARGIGLGLVVVKNLTQANGGSVEVQSESGKGSTFSVVLPGGDSPAKPTALA